jgi:CBS domain-containing protein
MNVKDAMTTTPARCTPGINLGAAVEILWHGNCGILPIVDEQERVISVITARDICIALGTRNRLAGEITVGEVATHRAICCGPDDDVRSALAKMVQAKVRRLPVVNAEGKLEGILAMDDVVAPIVIKSGGLKSGGLKDSGRGSTATSSDALSTTLRSTDSPASRQGRRLNT